MNPNNDHGMKLYEHITTSDHIRFEPFNHSVYKKGDLVVIGGITGTADVDSLNNEALVISCGTPRSVFRAFQDDITGDAAVGANLYLTPDGALTMTESGNTLFGVITDIAGAVSFVKVGA